MGTQSKPADQSKVTLNLALVGHTSYGKSSTGDTLFKKNAFQISSKEHLGNEILDMKSCSLNDQFHLKVYDTPGNRSLLLNKKHINNTMNRLMEAAGVIDVFILVYKFSNKFSEKDKESIIEIEKMFGTTFLEKHGIVVVTHGDLFDQECPDLSFEQWLDIKSPELKTLSQKVKNRMLLVYNKGEFTNESKRMTSSQQLQKMITTLCQNNVSYKKNEFDSREKKELQNNNLLYKHSCIIL